MRYLLIVGTALGVLALPSSAFANHGGNDRDCQYAFGKNPNSGDLNPHPDQTLVVYADTGPPGPTKVGACNDFNDTVPPEPVPGHFDGGTVEAGVGEDPADGAGDPGLVSGQPDVYAVVDGDDDNVDPLGRSDDYVGISNWETANDRTAGPQCLAGGPNNGAADSSNSGGCVRVGGSHRVYVPLDLPTPVCGDSTGNAWDGSGTHGAHRRDGCDQP